MAQHSDFDSSRLLEIQNVLIEVAKQAGEMITGAKPIVEGAGSKKNSADLVTETDQAVEKMVSTTLMSKYPSFEFLGEETYKPGMKLTSAPTFVVDPIDGTTNFVHRYPYVSISLGFAVNKEPVVGIVFNPFTQQLYSAVKGDGAYLTDLRDGTQSKLPLVQPFQPLTNLSESLIAIEWGSDRSGVNYTTKVKTFTNLCKSKDEGGAMVHSLRSFGSAALNLCAVASGSIDMYWEGGCWPWDVCAGWVILKEAGGIIVDGNPGNWDVAVDSRKYLAVRGAPESKGQKEIVDEFWSHVDGRMEYES